MLYLAASFAYDDRAKTEERKSIIENVVGMIQQRNNVEFYIPHKFIVSQKVSLKEWSKIVFDHDVEMINKCDAVVFLSFGKQNNSGAVWETGYAYGIGKKLIVISMTDETESLMVCNSAHAMIHISEAYNYDFVELKSQYCELKKIS